MATNCYVGKLNEDNTVDCIFIKHNGRYEDVGTDLLTDFNDEYSAHDLIASGNGNTLYDKRKDVERAYYIRSSTRSSDAHHSIKRSNIMLK